MSLARIFCFPTHRGSIFTPDGVRYLALLNGQPLSRDEYPFLSEVWPSGVYGAPAIPSGAMHLPNVNNLYLRGADFGRNADPDKTSRVALSGTAPAGDLVGSYQPAVVKQHTHASGSPFLDGATFHRTGGGEGGGRGAYTANPSGSLSVVRDSRTNNRYMEFNNTSPTAPVFDVDHSKVFYYIQIS